MKGPLTQDEIAERLGVSRQLVTLIEKRAMKKLREEALRTGVDPERMFAQPAVIGLQSRKQS